MKSIHGKSSAPPKNKAAERGNVMIYILIAIVLFAALSYTVSGMMRGGNADMIGEEKAKLLAGEILDYGRSLRQGLQNIKISNGCSNEEIRFVNNITTGYSTSVRNICDVFNSSGANLNYIRPNSDALASITPAPALFGEWYFTGGVCAEGVGTPDTGCTSPGRELIVFLPYVNLSVCIAINDILGVANPSGAPPVESAHAWPTANHKFTGNFTVGGILLQQGAAMAGCFEGDTPTTTPPEGTYHFYQILLVQ